VFYYSRGNALSLLHDAFQEAGKLRNNQVCDEQGTFEEAIVAEQKFCESHEPRVDS